MNWLDTIRLELDNIDETEINQEVFDGNPVKKNEQVAGVAPPELRKILLLSRNYAKQSAQLALDGMFGNKNPSPEDVRILNKLKIESEEIKDLFWVCIRQHFDLWAADSIGIREGWKIVSCEKSPEEIEVKALDITDIIKKLRGL